MLSQFLDRLARVPVLPPLMGTIFILLLWQLQSTLELISLRVLPPPYDVWQALVADVSSAVLWTQVATTLQAASLGLVIGFIGGLIGAVLMAASESVRDLLQPFVVFLNALPRAILAPFFLLIFGLGMASSVALAVSLVVFPVLVAIFEGFRAIPENLRHSVRILGGREWVVWTRVNLPGALPHALSALKLAVSLALLGAVVGELLISTSGLGWLLKIRGQSFQVEGVFSALIVLGALVGLGNALVDLPRSIVDRWQ